MFDKELIQKKNCLYYTLYYFDILDFKKQTYQRINQNQVYKIDEMSLKSIADAYELDLHGEKKKELGKKRGRKPKSYYGELLKSNLN